MLGICHFHGLPFPVSYFSCYPASELRGVQRNSWGTEADLQLSEHSQLSSWLFPLPFMTADQIVPVNELFSIH